MKMYFNTLLIPVDFSQNTEIAIKKAAELASADLPVLHLLHVARSRQLHAAWGALRKLQNRIKLQFHELPVMIHIIKGYSVQRTVIKYARNIQPDLILIGKQYIHRPWDFGRHLSPDIVALKTKCPVLTVKPGGGNHRMTGIVVPIRDFLPQRKLEWAIILARKYKAQIYLLAIRKNKTTEGFSEVFLHAYHYVRDRLHHPVEISTVSSRDTARATLNYAETVMADVILVNPKSESAIGGLLYNKHISDLLSQDSKIQILDVAPYDRAGSDDRKATSSSLLRDDLLYYHDHRE